MSAFTYKLSQKFLRHVPDLLLATGLNILPDGSNIRDPSSWIWPRLTELIVGKDDDDDNN